MQMETYFKNDIIKCDYYTYCNTSTLKAGFEVRTTDPKEGEKAILTGFLFDSDNRCFMMLLENEGSKTGIISTIPSDTAIASKAKTQKGASAEKATTVKTGNTRIIA